jgi:hypothetical protein
MEKAICDEARVAEHNRFRCSRCRKRIKKGLPVLRKAETTKFGYQNRSFCHRCAEREIANSKDAIKILAETMDKTEKEFIKAKAGCTKALVLEALEYEEERKKREIMDKKFEEELERRQAEWEKEQEEHEKLMKEFNKWKARREDKQKNEPKA